MWKESLKETLLKITRANQKTFEMSMEEIKFTLDYSNNISFGKLWLWT